MILFFISLFNLFSQDRVFERGEALFMENKPAEAIPLLLSSLEKNPENEKLYMMLGISYSQTGNYANAVNYFKDGARVSAGEKDIYFYNAGNIYYLMGEYQLAEDMFSRALRENRNKGSIYLNRANARLMLGRKEDAVNDYKTFLVLDPLNYQKDSVEKLIALLETKARQETARKQEEEARRIAEEQRREELLRDVLDSLKQVSQETRKVSAETETISDYQEDLELKE